MKFIDLNGDVGERFGDAGREFDKRLMQYLSSVNIACGGHAGNIESVRETIASAKEGGVAIGAHPGYPDPENFGRKVISLAPDVVASSIRKQCMLVRDLTLDAGCQLCHVKPHGALYHQVSRDDKEAEKFLEAIADLLGNASVVGMPDSAIGSQCKKRGIPFVREFFADREIESLGVLVDRANEGSLIEDPRVAVARTIDWLKTGKVNTIRAIPIDWPAETICIHGDGTMAEILAKRLAETLHLSDWKIRPPAPP